MSKFSFKNIPTVCIILVILSVMFVIWGAYQSALSAEFRIPSDTVILTDGMTSEDNDGKYVLVSGEFTAENRITDPATGVSVEGLMLLRTVEMYQYGITGSGSEDYEADFRSGQYWNIEGENGEQIVNPVMPDEFQNDAIFFAEVHIDNGNLTVNERYIRALTRSEDRGYESVECDPVPMTELEDSVLTEGYIFSDGYVTNGDPENPQIGDIRIRYSYLPVDVPGRVSVFGKQENLEIGSEDDSVSVITSGVETVSELDQVLNGDEKSAAAGMFLIAAVLLVVAGVILFIKKKKGEL